MYQTLRTITLRETDATGVLYFSEQLKLALEAFESYLASQKFHLGQLIDRKEFLLPVVHVEADYKCPLRVGDQVKIELSLEKKGQSSFGLRTLFFLGEELAATVSIVHVVTSRETGRSMPLPQILVDLLEGV